MQIDITREAPDTPDAISLVEELDAYLIPMYPISSHHGLSIQALIDQGVHFFVMRVDGQAAGCGGFKPCDGFTELKRMYIRPQFRGQGLAGKMLAHLEDESLKLGFSVMRLETGYKQVDAIGLYEKAGFTTIPAFEPYLPDPLSLFYEKKLG